MSIRAESFCYIFLLFLSPRPNTRDGHGKALRKKKEKPFILVSILTFLSSESFAWLRILEAGEALFGQGYIMETQSVYHLRFL